MIYEQSKDVSAIKQQLAGIHVLLPSTVELHLAPLDRPAPNIDPFENKFNFLRLVEPLPWPLSMNCEPSAANNRQSSDLQLGKKLNRKLLNIISFKLLKAFTFMPPSQRSISFLLHIMHTYIFMFIPLKK